MSAPFDELSTRAQVSRLRSEVVRRLALEGRPATSCRMLGHQHNTTFHHVAKDGREAFVRVSRTSDRSAEAIRAEAEWVFELHRDGHPVALPFRWSDGRFEQEANDSALGPDRVLTYWEWRAGRQHRKPTPEQWRAMGAVLARFHEHTEGRDDLGKGRWQVDGAVGNSGDVEDALRNAQDALGADVRRTLETVIARYDDLRPSLGKPQLIHGDLHQWNVLFNGDDVSVVDFDDCGLAPALYDFCVPIQGVELTDADEALLAGYRDVRPVPELLTEALPIMLDFRMAQLIFWVLGERTNPEFAGWWEKWCREKAATLAAR